MLNLKAEKLNETITKRAKIDIESKLIIGANVYVSQAEKVFLNSSYGYKTVDKREMLNNNSIFRLASMTKPIIAVAVLKLIDKSELDLFDRVDKYIENFNGFYVGKIENGQALPVEKAKNPIRVLDLLTHSSGLGSGELWDFFSRHRTDEDKKDLKSIINFYKKTHLSFEPYCGNEYSAQAGFDVLARIIEIITNRDIEDYLKDEMLTPLEMKDTAFTPTEEQWNRLVDMHDIVNGENVAVNMNGCIFSNQPVTYKCGGAGLVSTISDYANFAEMLLNRGVYKGKRIISENSVRTMAVPHILEKYTWSDNTWGLGVRIVKENNRLPVGCFVRKNTRRHS